MPIITEGIVTNNTPITELILSDLFPDIRNRKHNKTQGREAVQALNIIL